MRVRSLLFLFISLSYGTQAQVTIDAFLSSVWGDPELKAISAQHRYLYSKPYRLAPIQKMEFRTENNQLDPDRQEYSLRVNPANPWEMKGTSKYFQTYQEILQIEQSRALKDLLMIRYEQVVIWLYYYDLLELKKQDKTSTEKLLRIMEAQRSSDYFNAEDYFDLKLDLVDKVVELEETYFELDNQKRIIESHFEGARLKELTWYNEPVLSLPRLEQVIDSIWVIANKSEEVAYREKKLQLTNDAWKLEKSNINMGFLQARYQEFRLDQDRSPWSVSLGVTIPIFNPNKGDMTRRQLDSYEAQGELDKARIEQENGRLISRNKVKDLIKRYNEIESIGDSLTKSNVLPMMQAMDSNPATTIRAESNFFKMNMLKARLRKEVLITYFEFLSYSEVLQQMPLVNYLSPSLKTLSP